MPKTDIFHWFAWRLALYVSRAAFSLFAFRIAHLTAHLIKYGFFKIHHIFSQNNLRYAKFSLAYHYFAYQRLFCSLKSTKYSILLPLMHLNKQIYFYMAIKWCFYIKIWLFSCVPHCVLFLFLACFAVPARHSWPFIPISTIWCIALTSHRDCCQRTIRTASVDFATMRRKAHST